MPADEDAVVAGGAQRAAAVVDLEDLVDLVAVDRVDALPGAPSKAVDLPAEAGLLLVEPERLDASHPDRVVGLAVRVVAVDELGDGDEPGSFAVADEHGG